MTDFEIAQRLTVLLHDCEQWCLTEDGSEFYHCGIDGNGYYSISVIDINNPSDMWPVIVDLRLKIEPIGHGAWRIADAWGMNSKSTSLPLRAAALVAIKVLEARL